MKIPAIIVDIDGTLADRNGRHIHDYDSVGNDWRIEAIISLVSHYAYGNIDASILFVTGRPERCREATLNWLVDAGFPPRNANLFMRKDGDRRKDFIVKKEIYDNEIKDTYNVLFVLEDRTQVVRMWRDEGLVCLQVRDGDY